VEIAGLYRLAMHLHSGIPCRLFKGNYAFPAWHYYLEVTRRCNLRCSMCQYIQWLTETPGAEQQQGELTTAEWQRVIDQTGRFSLITFTGGEPWVRRDFMDLLEYACARRLTHCITNGTLLTEERAKRCVELAPKRVPTKGFVSLGISLDAPGDRHDAIRGQEGAFEKATQAVGFLTRHRTALGKRWPMVHVTSVIQADILDVLPDMPGVARDIGASVLNLTLEIRYHDFKGLGQVDPAAITTADFNLPRLDRAALEHALAATCDAAKKAGVAVRLPRMPVQDVIQYYTGGLTLDRFRCRAPWTTLFVGRRGGVFPCFLKEVGNVRDATLRALWNGPAMRSFRAQCRTGLWPVCQGCCEMEHGD